jgi:hypothetical protein
VSTSKSQPDPTNQRQRPDRPPRPRSAAAAGRGRRDVARRLTWLRSARRRFGAAALFTFAMAWCLREGYEHQGLPKPFLATAFELVAAALVVLFSRCAWEAACLRFVWAQRVSRRVTSAAAAGGRRAAGVLLPPPGEPGAPPRGAEEAPPAAGLLLRRRDEPGAQQLVDEEARQRPIDRPSAQRSEQRPQRHDDEDFVLVSPEGPPGAKAADFRRLSCQPNGDGPTVGPSPFKSSQEWQCQTVPV